jgi:hypothetical protein
MIKKPNITCFYSYVESRPKMMVMMMTTTVMMMSTRIMGVGCTKGAVCGDQWEGEWRGYGGEKDQGAHTYIYV